MKNNWILKFGFVTLFIIGVCVPTLTQAESSIKMCSGDYLKFLSQVRTESTRKQIFKDFVLPYCQLYDVMTVEEELDELRDAFRTASFNCENTEVYKEQYHELLMEQYFIRNVQKSRSDVINAKDAEEFDAKKTELLSDLKQEMYKLFVTEEKRMSKSAFTTYFEHWSAKYDDRIGKYNSCDEGPWAELTETWTDFIDTMSDLSIDIKKPEKKSLKEILVPKTEVDYDEDMSALGKAVLHTWDYLKSLRNKEGVDIEAPLNVGDLYDSDEKITFENVLGLLDTSEQLYDIEKHSGDRMAKYTMLYGYGGAVATTDMQSILDELNRILEESNTKDFPNIVSAAAKIYDKQCN